MGFVRGIFLVLASMIFFLAVLLGALFYTVFSSLSYENVQVQAVNIFQPMMQQLNLSGEINSSLSTIKSYCSTNSDYVLSYQGYTFHFPCKDVNDTSLIVNDTINNFVSDMYYQNYDCGYWDCFSKYSSPLFLISEKSKAYWTNLFYYALAAAVASAIALFFLFKKKYDLLFLSGAILAFSSFLIMGINKIISMFPNQIVSGVIMLFFSQSNFVFFRLLIAGGILLVGGLIVELFRAGFKIYNMFSRVGEEDEDKKPQRKK